MRLEVHDRGRATVDLRTCSQGTSAVADQPGSVVSVVRRRFATPLTRKYTQNVFGTPLPFRFSGREGPATLPREPRAHDRGTATAIRSRMAIVEVPRPGNARPVAMLEEVEARLREALHFRDHVTWRWLGTSVARDRDRRWHVGRDRPRAPALDVRARASARDGSRAGRGTGRARANDARSSARRMRSRALTCPTSNEAAHSHL